MKIFEQKTHGLYEINSAIIDLKVVSIPQVNDQWTDQYKVKPRVEQTYGNIQNFSNMRNSMKLFTMHVLKVPEGKEIKIIYKNK